MAALVETPVGAIPAAGPAITARGWLLIAGVTLAALSEAISGTVLATGRLDVIGDIHATPDELAWLDVGYTATKLVAFLIAPWLLGYLSGTVAIRSATGLLTLACGLAAATLLATAVLLLGRVTAHR